MKASRSRALEELLEEAGIRDQEIRTLECTARFPSLEAWLHTDVKGWTLADMIDDEQYRQLLEEARASLARFAGADGAVTFGISAHVVTASAG